ncbi:MAG: hydrogenase maturation protease [Kofleriaceae bacterium]|nr:hydrogenase maturation protease [Kofleriaceae bacterium]
MTIARVIGLGARAAGDDGVGLVIVDALRTLAPPDVELLQVPEPSAAIPLLAASGPVVIVDAVLVAGGEPGQVIELEADSLPHDVHAVSTHGLGLARAVAIARLLAGSIAPPIRVVGVTIDLPAAPALGLSATVQAAVPRAVASVLRTLAHARRTVLRHGPA